MIKYRYTNSLFFSLPGLDRDRIAIGSEEGLYVIEVTRDGKLGHNECSNYVQNSELHNFQCCFNIGYTTALQVQ